MAKQAEEPKITVPYIPFKTFIGFIDKLKNSAVPPVIDASVMQNMSGSMKSQLMSALKALKLVQPNGTSTKELRELVKAYNTEQWQPVLGNIVTDAYLEVTRDVDVESGTAQQLAKAFKEGGKVDGQVLDKAVRFYLAAVAASGQTISPHFTARKQRKVGGRGPSKKKSTTSDVEYDELLEDGEELLLVNSPRLKFRLPIRGKQDAVISLPSDVTAEDWAILKAQLDVFITPPKVKGGAHD